MRLQTSAFLLVWVLASSWGCGGIEHRQHVEQLGALTIIETDQLELRDQMAQRGLNLIWRWCADYIGCSRMIVGFIDIDRRIYWCDRAQAQLCRQATIDTVELVDISYDGANAIALVRRGWESEPSWPHQLGRIGG